MLSHQLGFMQGRLSPIVDGKIQAFPKIHWQDEFQLAQALHLTKMEWTLDQEGLHENPLLTDEGQAQIKQLCETFQLSIPSVTGDCFMQSPFYKAPPEQALSLIDDFKQIVRACGKLNIQYIVVPLVDNGRLENQQQTQALITTLSEMESCFKEQGVKIVFESDYKPAQLKDFIQQFNPSVFGINYDMGNSAALGYDPEEELEAYGSRVYNVHIKDRVLNGVTVPLGKGAVKFETVFSCFRQLKYTGNYIFQTARATHDDHQGVLQEYISLVQEWI